MATILIIEDEPVLRRAIRRILEGAGHQVREASEGGEGLRLYREQRSDLVICDLVMPEKEGIETIRELRAHDQGVKILVVSGSGQLLLEVAKRLGADAALGKPVTGEELKAAVDGLVG